MTYSAGVGFVPTSEAASAQVLPVPSEPPLEAIKIADLNIETVPLCEAGNLLPVGVKLPDETARSFGLGTISAATKTAIDALIADALKDRNSNYGALSALPGCLSKAVDVVGDRPLSLISGQFFSNSFSRLFDAFYIKDLVFLCFAIRLKKMRELQHEITELRPFDFVMQVQCNAQRCTKNFDVVLDFSGMDVGFVGNLPASHRIEVTLPTPFSLYAGTPQEERITHLHFHPTPTLRGVKKVLDLQVSTAKKDPEHRMSPIAMSILSYIADVPESSSMGNGRHWNLRFWHALTESPANLNYLERAVKKLDKIGPKVEIPMVCPCREEFSWTATVPWIDVGNFWYNPAFRDSDEL
jgi:hypothetical protein